MKNESQESNKCYICNAEFDQLEFHFLNSHIPIYNSTWEGLWERWEGQQGRESWGFELWSWWTILYCCMKMADTPLCTWMSYLSCVSYVSYVLHMTLVDNSLLLYENGRRIAVYLNEPQWNQKRPNFWQNRCLIASDFYQLMEEVPLAKLQLILLAPFVGQLCSICRIERCWTPNFRRKIL